MAAKKTSNRRKTGARRAGAKAAADASGQAKTIDAAAEEVKKPKKTNPFQFAQEVRSEVAKVSWTSRNETMISTIMVLIMVAVMSLFFFVVDQGLQFAVCQILPIDCVARDAL